MDSISARWVDATPPLSDYKRPILLSYGGLKDVPITRKDNTIIGKVVSDGVVVDRHSGRYYIKLELDGGLCGSISLSLKENEEGFYEIVALILEEE